MGHLWDYLTALRYGYLPNCLQPPQALTSAQILAAGLVEPLATFIPVCGFALIVVVVIVIAICLQNFNWGRTCRHVGLFVQRHVSRKWSPI